LLLLTDDDGRELVNEGWRLVWPWESVERYQLVRELSGDLSDESTSWRLQRSLQPLRLLYSPLLPDEATLNRLTALAVEQVLRVIPARLCSQVVELIEGAVNRLLAPLGITVEGLRLHFPTCAGRILYLRLDGLDRPTLARLMALDEADSAIEWLPLSELRDVTSSRAALVDWQGVRWLRDNWLLTSRLPSEDSSSPKLQELLDGYAGAGLNLPGKGLLRGEGWLIEEAERLERGSRAIGALLASGVETVYWRSDLLLHYYDRLWPFVQKYRELAWGRIYPSRARVSPEERDGVVVYGELVEGFIATLEGFLNDLHARYPELRVVITSGCGYGVIRPESLSTPPWGIIELE
jgi:hypothetical protein